MNIEQSSGRVCRQKRFKYCEIFWQGVTFQSDSSESKFSSSGWIRVRASTRN